MAEKMIPEAEVKERVLNAQLRAAEEHYEKLLTLEETEDLDLPYLNQLIREAEDEIEALQRKLESERG